MATGAGASETAAGVSGVGAAASCAGAGARAPRFLVPERPGVISAFSTLVEPQAGQPISPRLTCLS